MSHHSTESPAKKQKTETKLSGRVFGMCNPLLDISAVVPEAMLEKYVFAIILHNISLRNPSSNLGSHNRYELKRGTAILAEKKHLPM